MTRAAEELAVSYPVESKTISELEHTLGVKLFDRSISGVEPTHLRLDSEAETHHPTNRA